MSESTQILLIGSTSFLTPAELSQKIAEIEESGLVMLSSYVVGVVLFGVFRKREPINPWNGPSMNPFQPATKALVE